MPGQSKENSMVLYRDNPIFIPNKVDQIGLLLSYVGSAGLVANYMGGGENYELLSSNAGDVCLAYTAMYLVNLYNGEYSKNQNRIPLFCSATSMALCVFIINLFALITEDMQNTPVKLGCLSGAAVMAEALFRCLFRRQYIDASGKNYELYGNSAILLGYSLMRGVKYAGAFAASYGLQIAATSALGLTLSSYAQFNISSGMGLALEALIRHKYNFQVDEFLGIEEQCL